ncbi:MAG: response regulator [Desulfobacteraceae bacterium]|jgi:signal transduction histidine kinase|nr:MAG: response regulator [Desulfobacteraceae bacterium]
MQDTVKVLVVDDEKVVREGCQRVLCTRGFEVNAAESGEKALAMIQETTPDVILLDLKMPGMSGEEVLEQTRKNFPDIPVIVITGHGTIDTAVECMKKGAYDFITKPFQMDEFLLTVNRAAEKRRLERKARLFEEENVKNLYDLRLEKSRLKTIINCMANGVMVTNRNLEVVLHNPALLRILNITKELNEPASVTGIVCDESILNALKDILSGKIPSMGTIAQEISCHKTVARAISAPVAGPDGDVVGTVTVLEDITAFKELDRMKSDFINMVAHELRSPVVSIRQLNSVMLEGLAGSLNEKQKDFTARGIAKADSLLELINDLLNVARLESGGIPQHRVPTKIGPIMDEVVRLMEPRAKDSGIRLSVHYSDLKEVSADPAQIDEVLNNLITNAINYSPDGGEVTVTASTAGEHIEIKVKDQGVGIPKEEISRVFEKFYRVKNPRTRKVMGTGLGLSIVKGIVEAHHGTISLESEMDKGTTFTILLPTIQEQI